MRTIELQAAIVGIWIHRLNVAEPAGPSTKLAFLEDFLAGVKHFAGFVRLLKYCHEDSITYGRFLRIFANRAFRRRPGQSARASTGYASRTRFQPALVFALGQAL